jgi:DNA-binding NarL/FixJ family response regulator
MESKISVMLVDDHPVVRAGLGAWLRQTTRAHVVAEACNVADAIAEAARHRPEVILMELRLRDGSGVDACRKILSADPDARVIFLTSCSDEDAVVSTVLAGASGYLLKDVSPKMLLEAIELVRRGQSILDPRVTPAVLRRVSILNSKQASTKWDGTDALSPQERRIMTLVVEGRTNKEIGKALILSEKTVKNYLSNAFQKMNVRRRSHAAALFQNRGA